MKRRRCASWGRRSSRSRRSAPSEFPKLNPRRFFRLTFLRALCVLRGEPNFPNRESTPRFRERYANHRGVLLSGRNRVKASDSSHVADLPLVGQPIG